MIVYDPIYGRIEVPQYLLGFLATPEVRRLSQIRLLNTLTPSLATLGELRRYSHTLGVLNLCFHNKSASFSLLERQALAVSILLHDIGTPPFGHLMEYHLKEAHGWTHEAVIKDILNGCHAPENTAHQIFAGRTVQFGKLLRTSGISVSLVSEIVTNEHPLAALLFGTVDLDNLDNVVRMAWALGISSSSALATNLAGLLRVSREGLLLAHKDKTEIEVMRWLDLRRKVYEILVFDPATVSAQAVLSGAIERAMAIGALTVDDWALSDEQLLEKLRKVSEVKDSISLEYLGRLPWQAFCVQLDGEIDQCWTRGRHAAKALLEEVLGEYFGANRALAYVFIDRGTFSKQLSFVDDRRGEQWIAGSTSNSLVLYAFVRGTRRSISRSTEACKAVLQRIANSRTRIVRCFIANAGAEAHVASTFAF